MDSYKLKELAARWQCSTQTLRRRIRLGELPAFKLGRDWRIRREDADAFAAGARA